eukprot:scaffold41273_cov39-Phaeocystis_antarctica.AAC.1
MRRLAAAARAAAPRGRSAPPTTARRAPRVHASTPSHPAQPVSRVESTSGAGSVPQVEAVRAQ